ncbi:MULTISPECIES: tetratricopeptide repeat protein [spotted fever group]|uniref:tetratricopeptide repeat protein n=1 Tax=spotted fever group TaxID=114277 RepID=UPI0001A60508|nr:tetratricopeptide repeat protein [Rickettsia endosymbiont of Ixodes scapularis]EER22310.1 tetratricopeptide repeat domain protein [Rickettsia endosymbiont of Ixodes scapularis]
MLNLIRKAKINKIILLLLIFLPINSVLAELLVEKQVKPVSFFVNRFQEIKTISENLKSYKIVSLVGVTSIGKTEITRKYAESHQKQYNLIWFFDSSTDLNEQFVALAKRINQAFVLTGNNHISENANHSIQEVIGFLAMQDKWLLVFDNLRVNDNNKLKNIINWQHNGHIIISSQDNKDLPNVIYVHKLAQKHALLLLQNILGKKTEVAFLEKLVEIFKGYPGPLVQGAMLIKEHNYLSLDEYKDILTNSSDPITAHMKIIRSLLSEHDNKLLLKIALINNQNFSKNMLESITGDINTVGKSIYNLTRFGLIKHIGTMRKENMFEMHDAIKNAILQINQGTEGTTIKEAINDIIDKLNKLMPRGVGSRYSLISKDPSLISNLEVILNNTEKYSVDFSKILELRKNLINYYMTTLNYYNMEKMKNWLEEKESSKVFQLSKMTEEQKISYSWYMVDIGIYEDFSQSNYVKALACYDKAKEVVKDIHNQPELKSTILFQIAQTQAFGGDIINAEKNMLEVDNLIQEYKEADFDMGLYWFIKAKIALAKGNYQDALLAIEGNIKAESHLPQDTFTAPTYILQSEILNYLGEYKKSYEVIQRIYKQEIGDKKADHEIHARILTQLSRAELGLGLVDAALQHTKAACSIFQKEVEKYQIQSVINTDLAAALVAQGDVLLQKNNLKKALEIYNAAEAIYHRRYGSNYSQMDDVSYLLAQGTKAACLHKSNFWKNHFQDQLFTNFGQSHFRSQEVITFCKKLFF